MVAALATCWSLLAFGWLSNSVSLGKCEHLTGKWLTERFVDEPIVYVADWPKKSDPHGYFGTNTLVKFGTPERPRGLAGSNPVVSVGEASGRIPFVVSVAWGWATGPLAGGGGVCRYYVVGTLQLGYTCVETYQL